jgi:hypothetical protein
MQPKKHATTIENIAAKITPKLLLSFSETLREIKNPIPPLIAKKIRKAIMISPLDVNLFGAEMRVHLTSS